MDYNAFFDAQIDRLKQEKRYRIFANIEREAGRFPRATYRDDNGQPREVTVWCSNDYLGMGEHPSVLEAMRTALDECGAGSGGTRNISGTNPYHILLENELAAFHNKQAALLFTSGYISNLATIGTLGRLLPDCVVFSDALNHNSMISGVKASRCEKHIFRHNDVAHLAELMGRYSRDRPKVVVFESVYSMDGDFAPIREICDVAKAHGALTYLDEVHGVGLYGENGAGVAARDQASDDVTVIEGTLAKAFGVMGGYIAGPRSVIDCIRSYAGSFIFTTSLSPVLAAGAYASVRYVKESHKERDRLRRNVALLKQDLSRRDLPLMNSPSHIVPLWVGNSQLCKDITDTLLHDYSLYIQPINYPTVPKGSERLRITPTPLHTDEDRRTLVDALSSIWATVPRLSQPSVMA